MNINAEKTTSEKSKANEKEKQFTLQGFISKINKSEVNSFGNYFVDFSEMFPENSEFQGYMKQHVSLFNDDTTDKKQLKNTNSNFFLKPTYFNKFSNETLFYIFYYMPRDTLQLLASEELSKRKWKYNTDYAIWFTLEVADLDKNEKGEKQSSEAYFYFNPNEWKVMKYVYGALNTKAFLSENEMFKYTKTEK